LGQAIAIQAIAFFLFCYIMGGCFWCIVMSESDFERDDIIEVGSSPIGGATTFTLAQLMEALKKAAQPVDRWITDPYPHCSLDGLRCRYLKPGSPKGWQKAKVRLRLEILIEEPPAPPPEGEQ
jgi:hypothetical protein